MNKIAAILLLVALHHLGFSQTNFILAGQTSGMQFTDYVPDHFIRDNYTEGYPPLPPHTQVYLYIYLNKGDILPAYKFSRKLDCSLGYCRETHTIFPFAGANGSVLCVLDTPRNTNCVTTPVWVAKKYLTGDTMKNDANSSWQSGSVLIANYEFFPGSNSVECSNTNSMQPIDSPYYYFLRLITGNDTLLGYVHLSSAMYGDYIYDYACQGLDSVYIINAIKEVKETRDDIKIYPMPFCNQLNITSQERFQYKVTDISGKTILLGSSNIINTQSLSPSIYILMLKNEEHLFFERIVKTDQ